MRVTSLLFGSVLTCFAAADAAAQVEYFSARLTGDQEVPAVTTAATGWGIVRFDSATSRVDVFVHTTGLTAQAAHLHTGVAGQNGPVAVPLTGGPSTWTGSSTISATLAQQLDQGGTYLNVHTAANPGGEIRGQVERARSSRVIASLDGSQSVPPNGSSATGEFVGFLHEPDRVLVYEMNVRGLSGNVAHIHTGAAGQTGGILFPLDGSGTRWCGVTPRFDSADRDALAMGNLYVNVHTSAFPAGEIRGQLALENGDFAFSLGGSQENPPVITNAVGHGCVRLNPDRTLTYLVTTTGLTATMAHFHDAPPGVNGPVVFPLAGGPTVFQGTTPALTAQQVADVLNGDWYVNVHTAANPGGEIRGQVVATSDVYPSTYGGACATTGGASPEIGADGPACIGDQFRLRLYGADAASPSVALFGSSRDGFAGIALPVHLILIGMPDCFLLQSADGPSLPTFTDPLGCAIAPASVPFDPALDGIRLYAQWATLSLGANALNLVSSNALAITVR